MSIYVLAKTTTKNKKKKKKNRSAKSNWCMNRSATGNRCTNRSATGHWCMYRSLTTLAYPISNVLQMLHSAKWSSVVRIFWNIPDVRKLMTYRTECGNVETANIRYISGRWRYIETHSDGYVILKPKFLKSLDTPRRVYMKGAVWCTLRLFYSWCHVHKTRSKQSRYEITRNQIIDPSFVDHTFGIFFASQKCT